MSNTVFLGNLPAWVTADDITSWLTAENLVADHVKVIRNPDTQESKGFAFIETPNAEEMQAIIRRFDRAPLEDRILRANPAQPPRGKAGARPPGPPPRPAMGATAGAAAVPATAPHASRRGGKKHKKKGARPGSDGPPSAFAEELAKAL
jgi:RNA recognition motif-containing protein